jgi:hypothetical protein
LKKGRNLWAIEVKTDIKALDHKKRQGLEAFCRRFPQARPVLINEQNYFEFEVDPLSYLEKKGTSHFRDEIPTIGTLESCDKPGSVKSPPVPEGLPDDHSSGPKISLRL